MYSRFCLLVPRLLLLTLLLLVGSKAAVCQGGLVPAEGAQNVIEKARQLQQKKQFAEAEQLLNAQLAPLTDNAARQPLLGALAEVQSEWGQVLEEQYDFERAIEKYRAALQIKQSNPNRDALVLLNAIGTAYQKWSRSTEALDFYQQALALARQLKDNQGEAATLNNLGLAYQNLSLYEKALGCYQQALPLQRQVADKRGEADTLGNSGTTLRSLGRNEAALDFYQKALLIYRDLHSPQREAITLGNIGTIYQNLNRYRQALTYYRQSLTLLHAAGDPKAEAIMLNNMGASYRSLERFDEALANYQQALQIIREVGNAQAEAGTLNNIGLAEQNLSHYPEALDAYLQALPLQREIGDRQGEAITLNNLMGLMQSQNQPNAAIYYGKQAVNLKQAIRHDLSALSNEVQQGYLQSQQGTYRDLVDLLVSQSRLVEAQQVLAMLKEQEYFEFIRQEKKDSSGLSETSALNSVEGQLQQQDQQIGQGVVLVARELESLNRHPTPENAARREQLSAALKEARKKYNAFLASLPQQFGAGVQPATAPPGDLEALRSDVRELERSTGIKSALLYTLVSRDRYSVIFIAAQGAPISFSTDIKAADLAKKVFDFRNAITERRPVATQAKELYQILFCNGALEGQLKDTGISTLMWSLDGALRYLPIAALHDGQGYLVQRFSNQVLTVGSLARLKDSPQTQWRALGMGTTGQRTVSGPLGDDHFGALPGVENELRSIVRDDADGFTQGILPGLVRLDNKFNHDEFIARLQDGFPVVHIASHFRLCPGNNAQSYLLLGEQTPDNKGKGLTLEEVQQLNDVSPLFQDVDLVTLSACETALDGATQAGGADKFTGAEVDSFGALVQKAGARSVLASLWSVSDVGTSQLMREFYQRRSANPNITKIEALREAQLALIQGRYPSIEEAERAVIVVAANGKPIDGNGNKFTPDAKAPLSHPYYWAPFVLMGNWR